MQAPTETTAAESSKKVVGSIKNKKDNAKMQGKEYPDDELLKSFVSRICKLMEERADINADVKAVYAEARDQGYDIPALKHVVKLKRTERSQEFRQNVNQYCLSLGEPTEFTQRATH